MNTKIIVASIILSTMIIVWSTMQQNDSAPATTLVTKNSDTTQLIEALDDKIQALQLQLAEANMTLETMSKNAGPPETSCGQAYSFDTESEALPAGMKPPSPAEQAKQKMFIVNPTPVQQETYTRLKGQLDDLTFISNLNFREFSTSLDLISLPQPMQLALLSKAVSQFNRGNVSEHVFLGDRYNSN